jgi:hypothetical protein
MMGETGVMLLASKTFLLGGCKDLPIPKQGGCAVMIIG